MAKKVADIYALFGIKRDSSWGVAASALKSLERATKLTAAAAVGALYGVKRLVEHATETATHMVAASAAIGLSIEKTQEWGYVAQQSGSNIKEFATGVAMIEGRLRTFAAGRGGKVLAADMKEAGVSIKEAGRIANSPDGIHTFLLQIADRVKKMGPGFESDALIGALAGRRAGKALAADFARGSAAILEMQKHFRELGGELTGPQAMAMRRLGNDINDVKFALTGLVNQAIAAAAPAIHELTQSLINMLRDPEKRKAAIEAIAGFIRGAAFVAQKLAEALLWVGRGLNWIIEHKDLVAAAVGVMFTLYVPLKFLSILLKIRSTLGGIAAMRGLGGLFGGRGGAAGAAAGGLGAPAAAGVAGAFPAAAAEFGAMAVVRGIAGALVPAVGLLMIGSALDDLLPKGGISKALEAAQRHEANEKRIAAREALQGSNAAIRADYRALYGHAQKVDPFALQGATGAVRGRTANVGDTNNNVTITNGPVEINVNAPGANEKVGEAVGAHFDNTWNDRMREAFDAVGGRGRGVR